MTTKTKIRLVAASAALLTSVAAMIPAKVINVTAPAADPQIAHAQQNPIDEIEKVAEEYGIKPEHLLAISAQESSLGKLQSGDNGCSRGWFHINLCANPDASGIIGDPAKEAAWVSGKLLSYGYHEDLTLSLARYNAPANPNYAYAELVKKRLGELEIFLEPYQDP